MISGVEPVERQRDARCKFYRKPADWICLNRIEDNKVGNSFKSHLGIDTNVFNLALNQNVKEGSVIHSPLCSIGSTPNKSTLDAYISQGKNNQHFMKLQYSPDSMLSIIEKDVLNQTDLLLDQNIFEDKIVENTRTKTTISRLTEMKQELQASSLSHSSLNQKFFGLKIALVSISSYVFKIDYVDRGIGQINQFRGDSLALRIRQKVMKEPLSLFSFYNEVLRDFSSPTLRMYLIEKKIRFNTPQILGLQSKIGSLLQRQSVEEIIELIFLAGKSEECLVVSFQDCLYLESIDLTSKSIWKALGSFLKLNSYFKLQSLSSIDSLRAYLKNLL